MNKDTKSYIQLCSTYTKRFRSQCPVPEFPYKAGPPKGNENTTMGVAYSFFPDGIKRVLKHFRVFDIRLIPRLIPQDDVWFCRVYNSMNFSLFILDRLTIHYQNSQGVVEDRFIGLRTSFFWLLHNGRRSCFWGGGGGGRNVVWYQTLRFGKG